MICTLYHLKLRDGTGGFDSVRLTTAPFDVVLDGDTYASIGEVLDVSDIESTSDISKTGCTIVLNGLDPAFLGYLESGAFLRAPIDIMVAEFPEGTNVISTYEFYHRGYCNSPSILTDYESSTVSISIETENVFTDIDRIPDLMRTALSSHSSRHSGDRYFEFVADVQLEEPWIKSK